MRHTFKTLQILKSYSLIFTRIEEYTDAFHMTGYGRQVERSASLLRASSGSQAVRTAQGQVVY